MCVCVCASGPPTPHQALAPTSNTKIWTASIHLGANELISPLRTFKLRRIHSSHKIIHVSSLPVCPQPESSGVLVYYVRCGHIVVAERAYILFSLADCENGWNTYR